MSKLIEFILDKRDEKKKEKALAHFPFCYTDRHGRKWFNTTYCCGYGKFRKFC